MRKTALIFLGLITLGALLYTACGGDGDNGDNGDNGDETPTTIASTHVPRTTCKAETPVTPVPSEDLPPDAEEFTSSERAYTVRFPIDWEVQENRVAVQNISGDVFLSPAMEGPVKPNIAVTCETLPLGTDSQAYVEAKLALLEQLYGQRPEILQEMTISGRPALMVHEVVVVEQTPEPFRLDKLEVFFADDLGGWSIAVSSPEGTLDKYRAAFDMLVASFKRL